VDREKIKQPARESKEFTRKNALLTICPMDTETRIVGKLVDKHREMFALDGSKFQTG